MCGLKLLVWTYLPSSDCHTLRGCVDWNFHFMAQSLSRYVTPFVGVWIETCCGWCKSLKDPVTPFVGVWIETSMTARASKSRASHPSWVCGLKPEGAGGQLRQHQVTPFVGVWIETLLLLHLSSPFLVTPFVGVWIETRNRASFMTPTRVTPFVGVWIETENRFYFLSPLEKVIFAKTCHWLSISYKDKKYDSGLF